MAATFRQIVQDVLTNVGGSSAVALPGVGQAITDSYQLMIVNFVNHIKEECENAFRWRALRNDLYVQFWGGAVTFTAPLANGAVAGTMTTPFTGLTGTYPFIFNNGANTNNPDIRNVTLTQNSAAVTWTTGLLQGTATGATFGNSQLIIDQASLATPNSRSKLVRQYNPRFGREVGLVFDVTSFGIPFAMGELPLDQINYYNTVLNQTPVAYSTNYAIHDYGNDVVNLDVYPGATALRTIKLTFTIPQPRILASSVGNATYPWIGTVGLDSPILIPNYVIELGASWWAQEERGEELGANAMFSEERYRNALDDAGNGDQGEQGDLVMIVA